MTYEKVFADVKKALTKADIATLNTNFAFQMNITGEGAGSFYVAFIDGTFAVEPFDYVDANANFHASGADFIALAKGTLSFDEAIASGALTINGDMDVAESFKLLTVKSPVEKKPAAKKAAAKKPAAKKPVAKAEETKPAEEKPAKAPAAKKPAAKKATAKKPTEKKA